MTAKELQYKTTINPYWETYIYGNSALKKQIENNLRSLPNIVFKSAKELNTESSSQQIAIYICDFNSVESMKKTVQNILQTPNSTPATHKIIVSAGNNILDQECLFFSIELGVEYTAFGEKKISDLKKHIKRHIFAPNLPFSISSVYIEIDKHIRTRNDLALKEIADRLLECPKDNEGVLRLQVTINKALRNINKSAFYLKKLLTVNPQNLWAANELGRLYLRSNKVLEGTEQLNKLSQFYDLQSESKPHHKPNELDKKSSKNKSECNDEDMPSALSFLNKPSLSEGVLAFLNMRAVMAIKSDQITNAIRYYKLACNGCPNNNLMKAKILFNIGLAHIKAKDPDSAYKALQDSLMFGGRNFYRAEKPLRALNEAKLAAKQKRAAKNKAENAKISYEDSPGDLAEIELEGVEF
ncbi:MAG: hypothetical protein R3B45_17615 [Bdellovibrionota bacterium]